MNNTLFDDELDVARCLDVVEGIAIDHHEVSEFAHFNRAEFILDTKRGCTIDRGGFQYRGRRQTRVRHREQFAMVGEARQESRIDGFVGANDQEMRAAGIGRSRIRATSA